MSMSNFRCKLSSYFFFQVGYVKSGLKIVNIGLYSCAPTNQNLYRNCCPHCNGYYHWESGIWPCCGYTPRRNWLAWHHVTNFRSCKLSLSHPRMIYTDTRHCSLLCSQVIPFVAGGFLYIGAVAVLPTWAFSVILLDVLLVFCTFLASCLLASWWHVSCSNVHCLSASFCYIFAKILSFFPSRLLAESKSTKQALREASTYRILLLEMVC